MTRRFWHHSPGDRPPDHRLRDGEIIQRATRLKIELFADADGDIHGEYSIGGGLGVYGEKDYDGDVEASRSEQAAAMRFLRRLLDEFEGKRDGGTCHG